MPAAGGGPGVDVAIALTVASVAEALSLIVVLATRRQRQYLTSALYPISFPEGDAPYHLDSGNREPDHEKPGQPTA